ncbi:MAG: hypothetical protein L3J08_08325 [Flavobacteriaceae bacterium]|nr:hypothetical protein [Flavobacteriaceae bacterium]
MKTKSFTKCLILIFLFNYSFSDAQDDNDSSIPDIVPPSPMAYEMTRFEAQQPSLYTGTANISIPIYTINFDGWKLPLSLSYNAGGIKPIQDASEAGLGWSLNATAVISRTVRSGDDLVQTPFYEGYTYDTNDYLDILNNWDNLSLTAKNSYKYNMRYGYNDTEPDVFHYNFFGFSGSFSLSKKSATGGQIQILKINKDGVKIVFNESAQNFTLTTPTGFKGEFTIKERSTSLSGSYTDSPLGNLEYYSTYLSGGSIPGIEEIKNKGNFRTTTAWYLEKITSPNNKEINFTYNISNSPGNDESSYISISSPAFGETSPYTTVHAHGPNETPYSRYNFSRVVHEHVYQTGVTIPNEISINFTLEDRDDIQANDMFIFSNFPDDGFPVNGASKLKRYKTINILGLNTFSTFNKEINLEQSYFNLEYLHNYEGLYEKYQMLRSRLDKVVIDDQVYTFSYNLGLDGLPRKSTFGIDHQGYYNGQNASPYLSTVEHGFLVFRDKVDCSYYDLHPDWRFYNYSNMRLPNIEYGIAGSLSKVKYPTGGTTAYTYEPQGFYTEGRNLNNNSTRELDYSIDSGGNGGNAVAGGLRIKEIESKDENDDFVSKKTYQYAQEYSSNSSGVLMTPMLHFANHIDNQEINNCFYLFNYTKVMSGQNTALGAPIGYSRVIENTVNSIGNSYSKEYTFENIPTDVGDVQTYLYPTNYKNGKLLLEKGLREVGGSVYTTTNNYQETIHNTIDGLGLYIKIFPIYYGGNTPPSENYYFGYYPYKTPVVSYNNIQITQNTFLSGGTIENETNYTYDGYDQIKEQTTVNSKNQIIRSEQKRINDYNDIACVNASEGSECMRDALLTKNLVSRVLEKINYVDSQVVSATGYKYDIEHGNVVLREVYQYDRSQGAFTGSANGFYFAGSYQLRITYDDYDDEGNILQYTFKDGITTSFIWGYDNEYPIVKGEGISYNNLLTVHTNALNTSDYEASIRSDGLTTDAFVTTYQFDPLTGMTKNTDAGGRSTYYTYDQFRRLKDVKDQNLDILQSTLYNYRAQDDSGGITANSTLDLGVVSPGTSTTKNLTITNNGNYDVTVDDLQLPIYFSSVWDNNPFVVRSGESFDLPITFNSPSTAVNEVSGILTLLSSSNIGGNMTVNLSATGGFETRILVIPVSPIDYRCREITYSFGSTSVRLENSGNALVTITAINSDDNKIVPSISPSGITIPPRTNGINGYTTFTVQLIASLTYGDNWDGNARLTLLGDATSMPNGYYVDIKVNCN